MSRYAQHKVTIPQCPPNGKVNGNGNGKVNSNGQVNNNDQINSNTENVCG